ncbi:Uma2 family endonuclease [Streptomyces himalayensis]|uniref:Uma2 family endonuclease n=1 Tax=Streptomyces himalayensis subsp. himalayensis TaxID=2756131 RepID=A0A7W0DHD3_9ACTN|nr:Uma2 family endonuclease [Streptomyces himalayensis]MBA2945134.1 Uma2 family endonuclease [Streptomyces himalayensis subsp. himalayensis]
MTRLGAAAVVPGAPDRRRRPQMPVEDFEELARRAPETVWLEFIGGRLAVKRGPDGNRSEIISWLQGLWAGRARSPWLYVYRGLRTESDGMGRVSADGVLALAGHFVGHGDWSDPGGVLMAVEVTAGDPDTDWFTRMEKPDGYAASGIPVYLLIDRDDCSVTVFTHPEDGRYRRQVKEPFGAAVKIPDPVGLTLETEALKEFVD